VVSPELARDRDTTAEGLVKFSGYDVANTESGRLRDFDNNVTVLEEERKGKGKN